MFPLPKREFKEMKIVPKSIEAIKNLAGDHELHIITSRPLSTEKETLRWLHKHFSLESFEKIHITEQMLSGSVKKTKAELCKDLGISIIIEDDLKLERNGYYKIEKYWNFQHNNLTDLKNFLRKFN